MPKVGSIASEPILLPLFSDNPSPQKAIELMQKVALTYADSVREFGRVLEEPKSRVALVSPVLYDSSGKKRRLSLQDVAEDAGFRAYLPEKLSAEIRQPLGLPTTKRKIVQREVYVFERL